MSKYIYEDWFPWVLAVIILLVSTGISMLLVWVFGIETIIIIAVILIVIGLPTALLEACIRDFIEDHYK